MTPDIDALWRELEAFERRLRAPAQHDAHHGADWFDDWRARLDRMRRVRGALFLSGSVAQRLVAERLSGIDLSGVGEILLSACKDVAVVWGGSVVLGGVAGGAIGFFGFGVGAVPGAVVGAGVGTQVGAWVLGLLGLKALIEDLGTAIPDALRHYETGFKLAWGPVRRWEADQGTDRAPYELAQGHIVLTIAMLSALTAYLTRGRGDPAAKARVLQEIRESPRLGSKVADWVAANEESLIRHPSLKPRDHQVMMSAGQKPTAGLPVTPSQMRGQAARTDPPAPAPAPAPVPARQPSDRQAGSFGTLRARVQTLGTDPARGFIRAEGVGGARIEQALGRPISRSTEVAVDFVDEVLGPISLKGPIPAKGSAEGLANAAIKDANFNTATKALFVDLRGLSEPQASLVRSRVSAGTVSTTKQIFYLD
jgi:hypothetical protein